MNFKRLKALNALCCVYYVCVWICRVRMVCLSVFVYVFLRDVLPRELKINQLMVDLYTPTADRICFGGETAIHVSKDFTRIIV